VVAQLQLGAITESHIRALRAMGLELKVIMSSTGEAVKGMLEASPHVTLAAEHFFGDPSRLSYEAVGALSGKLHLIKATCCNFSRMIQYAKEVPFLVLSGAVIGGEKQRFTTPDAAWQQGATAVVDPKKGVIYRRAHADPMDLGQPLEEAARALGLPVTPELHLDFGDSVARLGTQQYPLLWRLSQWSSILILISVLVAVFYLR
jgi:hypothetical protein